MRVNLVRLPSGRALIDMSDMTAAHHISAACGPGGNTFLLILTD